MADIAAKPPPFLSDPGRPAIPWAEWHRSFATYPIAAGCEDFAPQRKAALLKTFVGTEAARIAHMIESARPTGASTINDYEYLVQGLAAHFDGATSQRANRLQYRNLRQAENESAIDFARRVKYLSRQCNFGSEEASSLVEQLIEGLASDRTRERLLAEGPALTFDKTIRIIQDITKVQDLLQHYRAAKEEIVQAIDGTRRTRPLKFPRHEFRSSTFRTSHQNSPPTTCGHCHRTRHPLHHCPALGKTCFKCGKRGHFRNACRTPRPAATHPSIPRVKRPTRTPVRNIEAPPDD